MHNMQYVNPVPKQSRKHGKCLEQSCYTVGLVLTLVVLFVLGYPLQSKEMCVATDNACECLCSVEEEIIGISLALMAFTKLYLGIHACVCVCWGSIYI